MKHRVRIRTTNIGGRYQHRVENVGRGNGISEEMIERLKEVSERLYEEIPEGATGLTIKAEYRT